jgi:MFS family permease
VSVIVMEVGGNVFKLPLGTQAIIAGAIIVLFALVVRSPGRIMLFVLMLIMMPLATTELGTDGWITSLMEPLMKTELRMHPAWVLVYTSFIMMVLRFCAGPIIHRLKPLGLLAISAAIAAGGLFWLSHTAGIVVFAAATLYALGKTFFWPTMLGVVSEQCPRGGALTLNAVGGMGMLAVGVLGGPFIGLLQDKAATNRLHEQQPAIYAQVVGEKKWVFGAYEAVSPDKVKELPKEESRAEVARIESAAKHGALATVAIFPVIMLACYILLIVYFAARGGYKPVELSASGPPA